MQRILIAMVIITFSGFLSQLLIFINRNEDMNTLLKHWLFIEITVNRTQFFFCTILMHRALYYLKRVELQSSPKYHTVEAIISTLKKQYITEIMSMGFNMLMIISWILFRNVLVEDDIQNWSVELRLFLGYIVSIINLYMVFYFMNMFSFFYSMLAKDTLSCKLFLAFTAVVSLMTSIAILCLCLIYPTINYKFPI